MSTNFFLLSLSVIVLVSGCKKKDNGAGIPVVTTAMPVNITSTTATGGGTVTGGSGITETGVCWSASTSSPTIADSKAVSSAAGGSFTASMTGLIGTTAYYVRAYATNAAGTAYGEVKAFTTGNAAPEARGVKITGTKAVGSQLTADYTYYDAENNPEAGTAFTWYRANDTIGATVTTIEGARSKSYVLSQNEENRYVRVGVTTKSSAGTATGAEVKSAWIAVATGETVTFTYMGTPVTYGVIVSPTTGRKWFDRNLGAPNAPDSVFDYNNFGDLFQWGRLADGHQLMDWANFRPVNTVTETTLSSTDDPGHNRFIIVDGYKPTDAPYDWRKPQNNNLWKGVSGVNNPCPSGWRIPTIDEFKAEKLQNIYDGYNKLKITWGGVRYGDNDLQGTGGWYWTYAPIEGMGAELVYLHERLVFYSSQVRASAMSVRCIKN